MEKIICDVCGTSYPETTAQCPICGYARPSKSKAATQEGGAASGTYVHVKGGRFSSGNVRKRNAEKGMTPAASGGAQHASADKKNGSNMALGITAIILLLVLIAVLTFFILKVIDQYRGDGAAGQASESVQSSSESTQDPDVQILCQELHTDKPLVELAQAGDMWVIHTTPVPEDTTDETVYSSSDPEVATVDEDGRITAVADGEAIITVKCGNATLLITVRCGAGAEEDGQTGDWSLNRKDITLSQKGETWDLYSKSSTVSKTKITWSSEDEAIATVDNGVVEAVGSGVTKVHAEYNGTTYSCTIRCKLPEDETGEGTDTETDDPDTTVDPSNLKISHTDVSLAVNESFSLRLRDGSANALEVTWTASRDGFVKIDGNTITGVKSTGNDYVTVRTTYEGKTYECIVRVK